MDVRSKILSQITQPVARPKKKSARKKKTGEPSTHDVSIQMAERGMNVEEIALERKLVKSTIEGHLTKGIESKRISIYKFIDAADVEKIGAVLKEMPEGYSSKDVYAKLHGRYTYGQIKAVMIHRSLS
jgi:uncharacterized protein YpbB